MGEAEQAKFEAMYHAHIKQYPPVEIKLLDGSPLDLNMKLDDLVALYNEQHPGETSETVNVEVSTTDDAPF
jgi:hypothetical protein